MSQAGVVNSNSGPPPPPTNRFPITPYVVGPVGQAGYQTIQAGLDAANAAGGGVVYIQPGQWTENLILFDGVDLYGTPAVSQNQGASTTIIGTHTPPNSGKVGFNSICFISTTNVISSNAAGSTHLVFLNCESAVQNGYFLNVPNWTGILEVFDNNPSTAGAPFVVNDGGVNNNGGSTFLMFAAGLGSGTNVMNLSGPVICQGASFECPVNFQSGSFLGLNDHVFNSTVTFSGNSTGTIDQGIFNAGSATAMTMSSSSGITISGGIIISTNNPVISGSGSGILTLGNVTYTNNSAVAGTVNLAYLTATEVGTLYAQNFSFNRGLTQFDTNGQLAIGSTASPNLRRGSLVSPSGTVSIGYVAPNITLDVNNEGMQWTEVTSSTQGLAVDNGYITNRGAGVTYTLPGTALLGDIIKIDGKLGLTTIAQQATQQIVLGANSTTVGVTGSVVGTNVGDCISLRCITGGTATVWRAENYVGNWSFN